MSKLKSTASAPIAIIEKPFIRPRFTYGENGKWDMKNPDALPSLSKLFCTSDSQLAVHMLTSTLNAVPYFHPVDNPSGFTPNMLVGYLKDQAPQSITETHLVLNMLVLHEQIMLYTRNLSLCKFTDQVKVYSTAVERLTKAYAKQATAFAKLRGKTGNIYLQQVNIHDNAQAVVNQGG